MNRKSKIVFVANSSWYLYNFRSTTLKKFSTFSSTYCIAPRDDSVRDLSGIGVTYKSLHLKPASTNPLHEIFSFCHLFYQIASLRPDIVYSFNPKTNLYALIVCYILRVKCVPNVSGVGVASKLNGIIGRVYKILSKKFYKRASHVFFQNKEDSECYTKEGLVSIYNSEILPGSGVDLNKFSPSNEKECNVSFLMAARLINEKGVVEYLSTSESISTNSNSKFYLAGVEDKSERAVTLEIVLSYTSNNDNLFFLGEVSDISVAMKDIQCVVLPSYYPEGTPRSLLEAAAAGKVIITTDTPGCRDVVIEGVNGFLVPPRDTKALKEAMEKVINLSDEKLAEMQASSRKLAEEKFDEQYVIQRYLDVAEGILSNKSAK